MTVNSEDLDLVVNTTWGEVNFKVTDLITESDEREKEIFIKEETVKKDDGRTEKIKMKITLKLHY